MHTARREIAPARHTGGSVYFEHDYDDCPDRGELIAEAAAERRRHQQMVRHPHPQDPDHPECGQEGEEDQ